MVGPIIGSLKSDNNLAARLFRPGGSGVLFPSTPHFLQSRQRFATKMSDAQSYFLTVDRDKPEAVSIARGTAQSEWEPNESREFLRLKLIQSSRTSN